MDLACCCCFCAIATLFGFFSFFEYFNRNVYTWAIHHSSNENSSKFHYKRIQSNQSKKNEEEMIQIPETINTRINKIGSNNETITGPMKYSSMSDSLDSFDHFWIGFLSFHYYWFIDEFHLMISILMFAKSIVLMTEWHIQCAWCVRVCAICFMNNIGSICDSFTYMAVAVRQQLKSITQSLSVYNAKRLNDVKQQRQQSIVSCVPPSLLLSLFIRNQIACYCLSIVVLLTHKKMSRCVVRVWMHLTAMISPIWSGVSSENKMKKELHGTVWCEIGQIFHPIKMVHACMH